MVGANVHAGPTHGKPRVNRPIKTPPSFRDVLLSMARSVRPHI